VRQGFRDQEMTDQEIVDRVRQLADSLLSAEGFELVDVSFRREARGWVLRLYADKEGGITLDDCAEISREIGRNLDVEDFIVTPYMLEVSSPGLTRSLRGERDFMKYRDRLAKVTTREPIGNRSHWRGRIRGVEGDQVEIEVEGELLRIALSNVAKANLELDPFEGSKPHR
jgi:ribosome maturation factor RimP